MKKPSFLTFALSLAAVGSALAQQAVTDPPQGSAADITRGRMGGDPGQTSTSIRIEGNANQGAGTNPGTGATSEGAGKLKPEPAAAQSGNVSSTAVGSTTGLQTTASGTAVVPAVTTPLVLPRPDGTLEGDAVTESHTGTNATIVLPDDGAGTGQQR